MLKQRFLVQFGSNMSLRLLGMISGIFVARIAGPEVLGTIAYATAYVSIFGFITGLFGTGHIKLISEGKNLGACMATYTRLQTVSIAIFFAVVLGWFSIQKFVLNHVFESKIHELVILIALASVVFTKLVDFNNSSFTGQLKQVKANLPHIVRGVLFQTGKIAVVLLGFRAIGLATWNLITAVIVIPIAYQLYRKLPRGKYNKQLAYEHIKIALPIFLIVVLNTLIGFSDKLILQHYTNSTELGYFAAAFSLGGMILMLGGSIGTVFFPLFSALIKENNWKSVNLRIQTFESFITTFIFPLVCLLSLIAEPFLLLVLGEKFQQSITPFIILLFASYFSIVGMPYGNIITGMGRFYLSLWLKAAKFVFYILAVIYFISPDFLGLGAVGLAINLLLVNLLHNILQFIVAKRIGVVSIRYINLVRYIIIITISIGVFLFIPMMTEISKLWWMFLCPAFLFLIFGVFILTGLLNRIQINELIVLINPQKTLKYIKKEINEK